MLDYEAQNKPVQVGMQVINAGYDTGLGLDPGAILSASNAASSASKGVTPISGAASGATIGSIVPGVGTVIGGIAGAIAGIASSIFGKKKKDPGPDPGTANATAVNQQRDQIRSNEIYQYYAAKGALANPNSPASLLEPPACDAFGSATEALRYMGGVLEAMRKAITSEPLFIKWATEPIRSGADKGSTIKFLMGAPFGLGNPAQSMRMANETFDAIAEFEKGALQAQADAEQAVADAASKASGAQSVLDLQRQQTTTQSPSASTDQVNLIATMLQRFLGSTQSPSAPSGGTSLVIGSTDMQNQLAPGNGGTTAIAGTSGQAPQAANILGIPNDQVIKYVGIAMAVMMFGFLFSPKGAYLPAPRSR